MNDITYAVSVDVTNPIIPYNVYVANVLDSNVRYLEITLYQNGNAIALSNEATATASLVTDDVLIDDSVECTISNNIITVSLEDLQRHGNLDVQVKVTEGTKVLAIPFPIQVRVTPNIAENAQIDENSLGSYAEVVHEIAEARGTYTTLHDAIAAKLSAAPGAVGTENLADESVTVEKVADDLAAVINAKEVKSNKKTTLTGNESSNDFYPTTKAVADAIAAKLDAAPGAVKTANIDDGAVTEEKLGEDVTNLFSELKDDVDKLNDDVLATSMWKPINFKMEIGTLNLAGDLIDNTTRIRTTDWISIDNITVLCKKPEHINDCVITNILCRNSEGEISNIPSSQFNGRVGYNGFKILTDTTCTYKFTVGYADNREITDILELMNYINFIDIKGITSLDYTEKIFEINGIRGCIKNGDTISFGFEGSGQVMSPFIYTFNANGTLNIDNPNSYSVILYKIDNNLNKLDRIVSTNVSAKFDIEENALYMINIYKSGLTPDAYVPMLARFCNPYSKVTELDTKVTELDTKVIELDSKVTEIPLTWEQGSFNAVGYDASNTVNLRTEKIETDEDSTYIFTVPNTLRCLACYSFDGNNRQNFNGRTNGFTIKNNHGFIRIAIRYLDGSDITYDGLTDTEKSQIHLYKVESKGDYDVTISSSKKFKAMFTVDGENCQHLLQALVSSLNSIKIKLYSGEYHLNSLYTSVRSGQQSFLQTTDLALNYHLVQIDGEYCSTRTGDSESTRIIIDYDESLMDDSTSYAGILVPRLASSEDDRGLTKVILSINGIKIIGNTYKKKMVYIDATHAQAFNATNVEVRADGSISGLIRFPTKPNEDCVGIRAGYGSNNGIQNYIKNCMVCYCGKGYSICGEHYILQDNLAHHCYIGFAFGDRLTRGNYEHPNIMIGCSVEGCYRLMLLSRYGETEESDAEYCTNTLICIGTSTELYWEIPTDELVDGENDKSITLPIKEVIKGVYRGRVEIDYPRSPFEEGSGEYMKYTSYWTNGIKEGIGSN